MQSPVAFPTRQALLREASLRKRAIMFSRFAACERSLALQRLATDIYKSFCESRCAARIRCSQLYDQAISDACQTINFLLLFNFSRPSRTRDGHDSSLAHF